MGGKEKLTEKQRDSQEEPARFRTRSATGPVEGLLGSHVLRSVSWLGCRRVYCVSPARRKALPPDPHGENARVRAFPSLNRKAPTTKASRGDRESHPDKVQLLFRTASRRSLQDTTRLGLVTEAKRLDLAAPFSRRTRIPQTGQSMVELTAVTPQLDDVILTGRVTTLGLPRG